ncbi:DUF6491 family protein [Roseibacterium beibuensis]|uniref:DUF6491 family protein n=1 Tax=[Roseibacterium] beibuensis TaxID=1193142 RepID=UPI00217D174A|nr:DUF6491 family protein [Roseibacterium beibuensis]MCS6627471.1 DUF6491 family protein [Roseibacterium beibuensis]
MTRLITYPAVAAALALTASCAPTSDMGMPGDRADGPERQCFYGEQVRNFRAGSAGQLYIRAMRDQVYELNSSGGCTDLDFAQRLAITPDVGGLAGGRICTGDWARITLPASSAPVRTCRARVSRVLTEAEIAALPDPHRP